MLSDAHPALAIALLRRCADGTLPVGGAPSDAPGDGAIEWLAARQIDSLSYLARGDADHPVQRVYDKVWHAQREGTQAVVSALAAAGIDPLVFKGAEILHRSFEPHSINLMADIDLLIDRAALSRCKPILYALGYRQAYYDAKAEALIDRDFADVAAMEGTHYELAPFSRLVPLALDAEELAVARRINRHPLWVTADGDCRVAVELDLHHGIATDLESAPFFARAVPSSFAGARTFCAADHLWFLAARLYNEVAIHAKESLRDFAYLAILLREPGLDWRIVLDAAQEHSISTPLFYYLSFLDFLCPGRIPADVLPQLDPLVNPRQRDWGWQLERLFGVVPISPFA